MARPLLRAVRASRPDAEITLIAKPQFMPLLEKLGVADRLRPLPPHGLGYFAHFARLSEEFPDTYLLFTNSARGDLEARLTGCRQRFGIKRTGKWRPLLTHSYEPPADFDESQHHQFVLWTNFLRRFGLDATPDLSPFQLSPPASALSTSSPLGLICGSENNPEKRWPVSHWRALIESLPGQKFLLLGTASDRIITDAVAAGLGDRVENLAGKTNLVEYVARLQSCRLLVTNDTGGMHLANMLGVPLVVLFGPTNPIRTGPIFTAPTTILQPPGCAPTGGGSLSDLTVDTVAAAVRAQLS
jgi:ADP-heptose:LPS heptosyltransferase